MEWLTDLIHEHPELAQVQARFREIAGRLAELEDENAMLRQMNLCMREEIACLHLQLEAMPWGLLEARHGEGEAVHEDRSIEADEPIAVANTGSA
jgi:hypothetical protein